MKMRPIVIDCTDCTITVPLTATTTELAARSATVEISPDWDNAKVELKRETPAASKEVP